MTTNSKMPNVVGANMYKAIACKTMKLQMLGKCQEKRHTLGFVTPEELCEVENIMNLIDKWKFVCFLKRIIIMMKIQKNVQPIDE